MRILQVVHNFLPEAIGGTEIYTYSLSKELSKHHKVYLFFKDPKANTSEFINKGNHYDNLPFLSVNPNPYYRNFPYQNLIKFRGNCIGNNRKVDQVFKILVKEFQPDIIHFQHLIGLSMNLINIAYQAKIPLIFTAHDHWLLCPKSQFTDKNLNICHTGEDKFKCIKCLWNEELYIYKKVNIIQPKTYIEIPKNLVRIILNCLKKPYLIFYIFYIRPRSIGEMINKTDLFITPSFRLKDRLVDYGISKNKIIFIDLGIDDTIFNHLKKTPSKRIKFAFIGSITFIKGIQVLMDAFNAIEEATLDLYGIASHEVKIKVAKFMKNKNIKFKGIFSHQEIKDIFSNIDVLIVPSICMENSPLVIREAFAAKTPVIASDIGGLSEMVQDGKTGLLFKTGDAEDLFKKISYFIDHPSEIERMSKLIKPVKSIKENAGEMETIYQDLILKNAGIR